MKFHSIHFALLGVLVGGGLLVAPAPTRADFVAVSIDVGANPLGQSVNTQTLGWDFTTTEPIIVTQLGLFDAGLNGFAESHRIGIWTISGTLLVDGTVSAGTGNPLLDQFRYVQVPEILLTPGSYVIGAQYTAFSADQLPTAVDSVLSDPRIVFSGPRFGLGASFPFPNVDQGPGNNHFGPNFQFREAGAVVPEPSTVLLLIVGIVSVWAGRCIRRRPGSSLPGAAAESASGGTVREGQ